VTRADAIAQKVLAVYYPVARFTRAERRPVQGPAGLSRQSVVFVVRS